MILKIHAHPIHVRWTIKRDLPEIIAIQQAAPDPWDEDCIRDVLSHCENIGLVAEVGDAIVGCMFYRFARLHFELLNLAVHPAWRRRGVGRHMMTTLKGKLGPERRGIAVTIPEVPVSACLFLRDQGFRCTRLLRQGWAVGVDGLRFQWRK